MLHHRLQVAIRILGGIKKTTLLRGWFDTFSFNCDSEALNNDVHGGGSGDAMTAAALFTHLLHRCDIIVTCSQSVNDLGNDIVLDAIHLFNHVYTPV